MNYENVTGHIVSAQYVKVAGIYKDMNLLHWLKQSYSWTFGTEIYIFPGVYGASWTLFNL